MYKELIIWDGRKYFYQSTEGERKQVTKKVADKIFSEWKKAGHEVNRKIAMNSHIMQIWPE